MRRQLAFLGVFAVMFGTVFFVQRDERLTAEHKVCVARRATNIESNKRVAALRDIKTALIEASENGGAVKGYVVPQSIRDLKNDKVELLPVPVC